MKKIQGFIGLLLTALTYSCANIGTPNGGPYDETPPRFVSSKPAPGELNYKGKNVEILFDELIQVDKPSENVIITPPQMQLPLIRPAGRKVVVELKDSLHENTTYTLDFTSSIADNNEKNVLENFTFAFSTGDVVDSLEIAGYLLNAGNLEPMPGITIGLHSNPEDTAFTREPFVRTSRTNDRGRFVIRNISHGAYRIFALNDVNRDYKFDQPGEEIAFLDSIIVPSFEFTTRQDTVWKDTLTIDTIRTVGYTRFLPDDIELRLFLEEFERQYMLRPERGQPNRFTLRFNAPLDTLPQLRPLNFTPAAADWYIPQWMEEKRAINYWLTDSLVWSQDTLQLELTYAASDSLNIPRPQTDTLALFIRNQPAQAKKSKKDEDGPAAPAFLGMQINASGVREVFDTLSVVFDEPVAELDKDLFYLDLKQDTVWTTAEFDLYPDTANLLRYFILRKWNYGQEYRLEIDSATIYSVYGKWNNLVSQTFKVKEEDQYGHLYIHIVGLPDTLPAFAELLNTGDQPVRKTPVAGGGALFMNLAPGKYYARLTADANNNFAWDTGNYAEKRQPETVWYYPREIEIMKNWQLEIQDPPWDIRATPFMGQKPLEITKNKPKEATRPKRDYRDEGRNRSSGSSSTVGGIRF